MDKIQRLLSLAGSLVFMLSLVYPSATAWAQGQPITFSAYGDIPYGSSDYPILQQHVADHNRYSPSVFLIHIGDMLSGSCDESKYADFSNFMKGLAVPAYIVVGDNEYSDCDDPVAALALWKKYFLTFGESFCGAPYTEHQSVRPENIAFTTSGVLFVGINLVGGSVHDQNEWDLRMQQDADWVSQQFQAKVSQVRAAVVFAQTGNRSAVTPFTTLFRAAAAAFAKPVLYIHGDLHTYKYDQPWPEKNITRLEVPKGNAEPPLEVTINMNTVPAEGMGMYTVKRDPWSGMPPYNMPPCANAGSDQALASLTASLQGQATDDGDPSGSLTTTWSMVSGSGTVTFGNANALATTASFSAPGAYVLRLTANDGQLQKSDEVTIVAQSAGPALSINDVDINEGNAGTTEAVFMVNLVSPNGQTVTVAYQTANGIATSSDYLPTSGTLSFSNGTTTQTIHVMIQGDQSNEPDETFFVNLSNASNATLADEQGMGTIINDDFLPAVNTFSPTSGIAGTVVTITGSHFTGATGVVFNGASAGFTVDSDTQIKATIPVGATTGKISITNADGTGQSATNFVVMTPPTIAAFTPSLGPEGTEVTITGSSLAGTTSVRFNGNEATSILVDSDSQIRARVPTGAIPSTGKIVVTNTVGSTTSTQDFTITSAPVTFTFAPTHDAYVSFSNGTSNYGSASTVRGKLGSSEINYAYLKFELTGLSGTVSSAKLRLYVSDASPDGGAVYAVANTYLGNTTPWIESGLSWNNAPGISGTVLSSFGAVSVGQWVEFDVTPAITGNGTYSFGLKNNNSDAVYYRSKEYGSATAPQLVIQSLPSNAPSLTSFAPSNGPVGTEVTITGSKFTGATAVAFNGAPAAFFIDSNTQIRATVPSGATTGKISVTNADGTGSSPADFVVISPPVIASFTPTSAPGSTQVTITGSSFAGATNVAFNGIAAASLVVDSDAQIRAVIPTGATPGTGKIVVTNSAGSTTSTADFTITAAPLTISFAPKHDAYVNSSSAATNYGTAGTVRGKLGSSEIDHGYLKFEVTGLTGTLQSAKLRLNVSDASTDGGAIYLVSNNYKSSTTPWIESGLNWNNAPGVSGVALSAVGAVSIGQWVEFDVTPAIVGNGIYSFGLKNNVSDIVYYRSKEGGATTVPQLVIQSLASGAPSITSFAPAEGSVGVEVTITGTNFSNASAVTFNGVPASFVVDSNTKIRATVPDGATSGKIRIANANGSASYAADFLVTVAPAITSFTPASGVAGTEVTITGSHFTGTTSVTISGNAATSFFLDSDNQIRANVPAGATPGAGKIVVTNSAGSATSAADFNINLLITFAPTHDTYVSSSSPATNYGIAGTVRGKMSSSETFYSYFKFEVTGLSGAVLSVKLWLYVMNASVNGGSVYSVSNDYLSTATPWVETGMNWTNAPSISGTALSSVGTAIEAQWVEFDLTPAITGDGTYSFGLMNNNSDAVYYSSKESSGTTNDPQLIIQTALPPTQHKLTVNTVGSGSVTLNPPSADGSYNVGAMVELTATPVTGFQFSGWSGDLTGSTNPVTITMDGNKNVTATFAAIPSNSQIVHEESQTGGSSSSTTVTTSASLMGVSGNLYLTAISSRPRKLVQSVTGLGLNWTLVKSICSGNNSTTGMEVWMAQGTPSGNGAVTATFATAPSTAVIAVSRYSGVAAANAIGNVIGGNTNGLNGACTGGVDGSAYSFNLTTTITNAMVYGAVALKARTHTPGAGYTEQVEFNYPHAINPIGVAVEDTSVASASTVTVNGSFNGTVDWALVALEIKPQIKMGKHDEITASEDTAPPSAFQLEMNYPNPFNPSTNIRFGLPQASHVTIKVYTINGAEVETLVDRQYPAGTHTITFHAGNLSSGTYFYMMQAGEVRQVRRLMLVR